jgi:hypothetical protein
VNNRSNKFAAIAVLAFVASVLASCSTDPTAPIETANCVSLEADVIQAQQLYAGEEPGTPEAAAAQARVTQAQAALSAAGC